MSPRAGLLQPPPSTAQINPGLSLSLDEKRGSRQRQARPAPAAPPHCAASGAASTDGSQSSHSSRTESVPLPYRDVPGARTPGLANVALLRRPADLDAETWRSRWHLGHTSVAIETQSTFGYTQNEVVRALTPDAPPFAAIVEELFPIEAVGDLSAFFGAADDADLADRMSRMVASTSSFGASTNIDTVPTSRYVLRSPFADPA